MRGIRSISLAGLICAESPFDRESPIRGADSAGLCKLSPSPEAPQAAAKFSQGCCERLFHESRHVLRSRQISCTPKPNEADNTAPAPAASAFSQNA